ncbi:hypothetical protein [Ligilactobacillus acidipiscis]|uniref:hypothetical protein n=1 Tax=Ligilactobacillus acidipiscis TaxID=89059 RepID=UPI0023F7D0BF|nr:hypothetical protein [Ligilactobacillus acidipiscis]WEV57418.1 hypothetical protein OZX66_02415 [Ligilactobacillus acidipiscis]
MPGTQLGISGFKAKKTDHDEIEHGFRAVLDFEEAHPDLYHYKSTSYYTRDVPENSEEEYWMFIDVFTDYEDYMTSIKSAAQRPETKEAQALISKVFAHADGFLTGEGDLSKGLPNLMNLIEHWTEVPSLRVDNQGH